MSGKFDVTVDARGVARLTVANDAKLNTLNPALLDEAIAALRELANHPGLRAAVLTGEGERAFIGGADIGAMAAIETPAEAEALIHSHKQLLIIDVRTQEEFAEGHISGARNVNFNSPTFLERMKEFEGKSILVHCAAGGRSARALEALSNASFAEIYHLNKGFNGWIEAGKPISTK